MVTRFVIRIGTDVLYLDEHKRPSGGFPALSGAGGGEEPALLQCPIHTLSVTGPEWDEALQGYTAVQREGAQVQFVVRQQNQ